MATETAAVDVRNLDTVEISKTLLAEIMDKSQAPAAFTMVPKDLEEAREYAAIISKSSLCPADYRGKLEDIIIAIQYGLELGLKPLQALQCIAVINGRPTIWGDGALAVVLASGLVEDFKELSVSDALLADKGHCIIKRKGRASAIDVSFSREDAETAKLWGKAGPWTNYPGRMMQMRARGFALRDGFADVLKGLAIAEEIRDLDLVSTPVTAQILDDALKAPRRKSEAAPLLVPDQDPKPSSAAAATKAATAPADHKPATPGKGNWEGVISRVEPISYAMKDQKTKKPTGKTGTWFKLHAADGQTFATFSESHAEVASTGAATKSVLRIAWEKSNGKENLKVNSIEPVMVSTALGQQEQNGDDDLPFEPGSNG